MDELKEKIIEKLRTVYDPEITSINIYDLGLVYEINVDEEKNVEIKMTLTSPTCPAADEILGNAGRVVKNGVEEVSSCHVELVWDPPFSIDRLSEEAKLELGILF